jgi:muramoyltetrapeptide carboxypeptidase
MKNKLIIPPVLAIGDIIGICTPSSPAYADNPEIFEIGVANLLKHGFKVKLGNLTSAKKSQGYRSGTPQERAEELMELFCDPSVKAILCTIGGMNSNSLIPYLDFDLIKKNPKIFCGYSDITSLHLSINHYSNLATYYGPGLIPHWGDYPNGVKESMAGFIEATGNKKRVIQPFVQWSNHFRNWLNGDWKNIPREWKPNEGWKVLNPGECAAPIISVNLNTLVSAAGTSYFPDMSGKILLLEEMFAPLSREERSLRQLQLMGVFDRIAGLIIGKPENLQLEGAPFGLDDLILEVVGKRNYPIISNFDCSHTIPMHTIRQESWVEIKANGPLLSEITIDGI